MQEWVEGEHTECPVLIANENSDVFRAYNYAEKGILPHSGGWAEQPAVLMRLVNIVKEVSANVGQ